jgi:hypothetical protein
MMKASRSFLFLSLITFPALLLSQVVNGSFENGGQPSLSGWKFTCSKQSSHDSPFDTSGWCLKLECGNYEGCFPGLASQIVPGIKKGEIWQLDAWTKADSFSLPRSIYWQVRNSGGGSYHLTIRTTSADGWVHLTVQDTFLYMNPGDSVAVVLDAGTTGGPFQGWAYFDLVSVSKIGSTGINSNQLDEGIPERFTLFQNYPNPFNPSTTFRFVLPKEDFVNLKIYGSLGQEVANPLHLRLASGEHSLQWNAMNMPSGNYFYRLEGRNYSETKRLILLK